MTMTTKKTVSYDALLFVRMLSRLRETAGVVVVVDAVAAVVYYSSSRMVIAAGIVVVVAVAGRRIRSLQSSGGKESAILRSALGSRIYSWHMLRSCSSSSLYRSSSPDFLIGCLLSVFLECCALALQYYRSERSKSNITVVVFYLVKYFPKAKRKGDNEVYKRGRIKI